MKRLTALSAILVIFLAVSCGGGGDDGNSVSDEATLKPTPTTDGSSDSPTSPPQTSLSPSPLPLSVELLFFAADPPELDSPFARFAAIVRNATPKPRKGVETKWTMFDSSGAIVGNLSSVRCIIPANSDLTYVGGAGAFNLSGQPARVEISLESTGVATEDEIPIRIEEVSLEPEGQFSSSFRDVKFTLTNDGAEEIDTRSVAVSILLRGEDGSIVGADFWSIENAPDQLASGARVAQTASVSSDHWTGEASSAEVVACAEAS